jgi:hypothetical protein
MIFLSFTSCSRIINEVEKETLDSGTRVEMGAYSHSLCRKGDGRMIMRTIVQPAME